MSTNSHIGLREGNKVKYIYCRWNGYLSHNGMILNLFYRNPEKVAKLISLGDISSLGYNVEAPRAIKDGQDASDLSNCMDLHIKTSFTVSYNRDIHTKYLDVKPRMVKYTNETLYTQAFVYLYDLAKKKWFVSYKINGKIKEYELDKLFTDNEYYANYNREIDAYESFETIEKSLNEYIYENTGVPVLAKYNEFIKEKGIIDIEFDYSKDKNGKRIYGLFTKKDPTSLRRTVIARSSCIGDLLIELLKQKGKNFYS